ncbi:hypothetical protein HanXRQr2_Chr14g0641561 [Helianthus annuus]|uniref:Uncharacterized protein n=1 Tax=Helianthus annuus TaxID=4232 RepID=A0A9K3H7E4_HELAN|nr:hypothetical protein HanXRQr2_Chr14g0641561 [Helianthus annuus]
MGVVRGGGRGSQLWLLSREKRVNERVFGNCMCVFSAFRLQTKYEGGKERTRILYRDS